MEMKITLCVTLLFLPVVMNNAVRELNHERVYRVISQLIQVGKAEVQGTGKKQFVSAVLMTEQEIASFEPGNFKNRFSERSGVYLNQDNGCVHGEELLLKDLDGFINKLNNDNNNDDNKTPPILVLFSTFIPCDKIHCTNTRSGQTNCAEQLRNRINDRTKPIQLFVSFLEVYSARDGNEVVVDFTNLDRAVNHLMSPDICLTYLVPRDLLDNAPISLDSNLNSLKLSPCLEPTTNTPPDYYKHLFERYPGNRPDFIVQERLYQHLVRFVWPCNYISGREPTDGKKKEETPNGKRGFQILAFAVNFAFKTCIQDDAAGKYCKSEAGPLSSMNRMKLLNCLESTWVDELEDYPSRNCRGKPKDSVKEGVILALEEAVTVGIPSGDTRLPSWNSLLGPWNQPIRQTGNVRCPNGNSPEYLCTKRKNQGRDNRGRGSR